MLFEHHLSFTHGLNYSQYLSSVFKPHDAFKESITSTVDKVLVNSDRGCTINIIYSYYNINALKHYYLYYT